MAEINSNFEDKAFVSALSDLLKDSRDKRLNLFMIEMKNQETEKVTFPGLEMALQLIEKDRLNRNDGSIIILCSLYAEWYFIRNKERKVQAMFNKAIAERRVGFILFPARLSVFVNMYNELLHK